MKPTTLDLTKGDKIRITQNGFAKDKKRLNNGAMYEVSGFTSKGDIKLSNGWVLPKNSGNIDYGYVSTSHASQGKTVDKVILAQSSLSQPAASREQFYVSVSRAKQQVEIFTDDKEELYRSVYQSKQRKTALDMQDQSKRLKEEDKSRNHYKELQEQAKELTQKKAEEEKTRLKREAEERMRRVKEKFLTSKGIGKSLTIK